MSASGSDQKLSVMLRVSISFVQEYEKIARDRAIKYTYERRRKSLVSEPKYLSKVRIVTLFEVKTNPPTDA